MTYEPSNELEIYFKQISKIPLLSKQQEIQLASEIKRGNTKSFNKLVVSNLRLVISIAKKYKSTIEICDAISCGNIGLIKAAQEFDPEKFKAKFGTYATWWIHKSILEFIYFHSELIKQPTLFHKLKKKLKNFHEEDQLHPTIDNLSSLTNLAPKTIIAALETISQVSLDASMDDNNSTFHEVVSQKQQEELDIDIDFLLTQSNLNEKEKNAVFLFFGFDDAGYNRNLNDVASVMNLSAERVRQLKQSALIKMKKTMKRKIW